MAASTAVKRLVDSNAPTVQQLRTVIEVEITGLTALLIHKGTTITKTKSLTPEQARKQFAEEWKKTAYLDGEGCLYLPDLNLEAMILQAGKTRKIGKLALKKYLAYGVAVEPAMPRIKVNGKAVTLDDVEEEGWIYVTGAVVQGQRIDRSRIMLPSGQWSVEFHIGLDSTIISPETLLEILQEGGRREGLCDWRPGSPKKPGKFGQFTVTKFDVHL